MPGYLPGDEHGPGESVEPLVYCVDTLRFPGSHFVYHNLKTGEEIYSMGEEKLIAALSKELET